jgi:hypothetical protein
MQVAGEAESALRPESLRKNALKFNFNGISLRQQHLPGRASQNTSMTKKTTVAVFSSGNG